MASQNSDNNNADSTTFTIKLSPTKKKKVGSAQQNGGGKSGTEAPCFADVVKKMKVTSERAELPAQNTAGNATLAVADCEFAESSSLAVANKEIVYSDIIEDVAVEKISGDMKSNNIVDLSHCNEALEVKEQDAAAAPHGKKMNTPAQETGDITNSAVPSNFTMEKDKKHVTFAIPEATLSQQPGGGSVNNALGASGKKMEMWVKKTGSSKISAVQSYVKNAKRQGKKNGRGKNYAEQQTLTVALKEKDVTDSAGEDDGANIDLAAQKIGIAMPSNFNDTNKETKECAAYAPKPSGAAEEKLTAQKTESGASKATGMQMDMQPKQSGAAIPSFAEALKEAAPETTKELQPAKKTDGVEPPRAPAPSGKNMKRRAKKAARAKNFAELATFVVAVKEKQVSEHAREDSRETEDLTAQQQGDGDNNLAKPPNFNDDNKETEEDVAAASKPLSTEDLAAHENGDIKALEQSENSGPIEALSAINTDSGDNDDADNKANNEPAPNLKPSSKTEELPAQRTESDAAFQPAGKEMKMLAKETDSSQNAAAASSFAEALKDVAVTVPKLIEELPPTQKAIQPSFPNTIPGSSGKNMKRRAKKAARGKNYAEQPLTIKEKAGTDTELENAAQNIGNGKNSNKSLPSNFNDADKESKDAVVSKASDTTEKLTSQKTESDAASEPAGKKMDLESITMQPNLTEALKEVAAIDPTENVSPEVKIPAVAVEETPNSIATKEQPAEITNGDNIDKNASPKPSLENELLTAQEPDLYIKHPLENAWSFWYLERDTKIAWEDQLQIVKTVDTVEDFWSVANHILPPSDIRTGCDLLFFKKGICPTWEDDANKLGGRWIISLPKNARHEFNILWLDSLMSLIGESYDSANEICGCVANVRGKVNKISLWTASGKDRDTVISIGKKWKKELRWFKKISYELHADSSKSVMQPIYHL